MYLDSEKKKKSLSNTESPTLILAHLEAQIALFSYRISRLTEHMKLNKKDYSTERAITKLVGKRRSLLDYLKRNDIERYRAIVKALNLRR